MKQIVLRVIMVNLVIKFADVKIIPPVIPIRDVVVVRPAGPEKIVPNLVNMVSMVTAARRNVQLLCMATRVVII